MVKLEPPCAGVLGWVLLGSTTGAIAHHRLWGDGVGILWLEPECVSEQLPICPVNCEAN